LGRADLYASGKRIKEKIITTFPCSTEVYKPKLYNIAMDSMPEEFVRFPSPEERERKIARELIFRFGMSEDEAAAFIDDFNSPEQTSDEPTSQSAA
jgi:hypothetical protein